MSLIKDLSVAALLAPLLAQAAEPQPQPERLDRVEVLGHYQLGLGQSNAASEGTVRASLIETRPALRPAELLEFVPGMIVTQHSGDGKANQYFLRGFNLDHGTDFASYVDGMPVNMVSHAHGQGYSDLNFLIPELVQRIDYRKGPYSASDGDFASAGSARLLLRDKLPHEMASLTLGEHGYARALLAGGLALGPGRLLGAVELHRNDGPWQQPEKLRKFNSVLRYSEGGEDGSRSLSLMAYDSRWTATDQIPARAVAGGRLDRFGSLDPSDGGSSRRLSLSARQTRNTEDGDWQLDAYYVQSRLTLFSNFTYLLDDPLHGDQFEQAEARQLLGGEASRRWQFEWRGLHQQFSLGAQFRHDGLSPVGLYATEARRRLATRQESELRQTSAGVHAELSSGWTPWLRSVVGLRGDAARFKVHSSIAENSGRAQDSLVSPKLALILGPWRKTELFLNYGEGFHSNDARGTVARIAPKEGTPVEPVPGLVPSRGGELGLRSEWLPALQSSLALWRLDLASELVFVGDAGDTEPQRASRRQGFEWNTHWQLNRSWQLDLDLAASKARYRDDAPEGNRVPGAVDRVASLGLSWNEPSSRWSAQFQLRHFGPRDLVEDGSQRSKATTLAYARASWQASPQLRLSLDVFNLFKRQASDIDYFYESRLQGEAATVADRHFHPVEPRSFRLTASLSWP
ncbi:TonB-dependent receptor [Roseateles violae]|uniref:TonB-dependent receptor n=1 Tax=Roseateles violae TaxID=3058042 RepID=A0ABT8DXG9_9BURK|nr:TonB-dependent receptor [Pelomonas sp. PFR6]MDN3922140.1 TonB-dependent receptor [Pelomonas sp. PFR6]